MLVLVDVFEARQLSQDESRAHFASDVVAEVEKELVAAVLIVEPLYQTSHDQRRAKEVSLQHLFWFRNESTPILVLSIDTAALCMETVASDFQRRRRVRRHVPDRLIGHRVSERLKLVVLRGRRGARLRNVAYSFLYELRIQ